MDCGVLFDLDLIDKVCIFVMELISYISYLVLWRILWDFKVIGNECFCVLGEILFCKGDGVVDVVGDLDISFFVWILVDIFFMF